MRLIECKSSGRSRRWKWFDHQAVAEEPHRVALASGGEGLEEGGVVAIVGQDVGAIVAAVQGMLV